VYRRSPTRSPGESPASRAAAKMESESFTGIELA
jgi:hypothetical protein